MESKIKSAGELLLESLSAIGIKGMPRDATIIEKPTLPSGPLSIENQWACILWNINTAEAFGTNALNGLILAFARIIQAEMLQNFLFDIRRGSSERFDVEDLLWNEEIPIKSDGSTMKSLLKKTDNLESVDISYTALIPQIWVQWRLARSFQNLGEGAIWGKWRDIDNVQSIAWKPWPIFWFTSGNHSTMAALLTHGGQITPVETYDAEELLKAVYTDGINWIRAEDNKIIQPVLSLPMAAIFEIGKRLLNTK